MELIDTWNINRYICNVLHKARSFVICPMYSFVLYYNIEQSGFNAVSASLVVFEAVSMSTESFRDWCSICEMSCIMYGVVCLSYELLSMIHKSFSPDVIKFQTNSKKKHPCVAGSGVK